MDTTSAALETLKLQLDKSQDLKSVKLDNGHFSIDLIYYSSLCEDGMLSRTINRPLELYENRNEFRNALCATLNAEPLTSPDELVDKLLAGYAAVVLDGSIYLLYTNVPLLDAPLDPSVETTLQGPQTAFSENIDSNLKIVRQRYPMPTLVAEARTVGAKSRTKIAVVYDDAIVDRDVLARILERIEGIDADVIQAVGQLEVLLTEKKFRVFPTSLITERPDRVTLNLALGKVVILMQGTPFAIVAPAVMYDFMAAMDDLYQTYWVSRFLLGLRYAALFLTVTLPAAYVAVVSYNPEIFRVQFALSIAGSRAAVPYPSYVEVFIMLFIVEALIEASLRLPRYIGGTATTVGGLILGQAAQQAGLVSSIMIIITSAVAISNFVIPITMMSFAFRIMKYPLIVMAALFGMYGLIAGLFWIFLYLCDQRSFGKPYLRMFTKEKRVSGYKGAANP